jgi:hypothetical protein
MKKIILVLLLTVLVLSSCSSKKSIDEYVTTDNTEYVKSYRKLVDEELCTTYLDKVGFTIGIVTSYSEYEECFDIKIRQYEHFYWDFVQEKDKHFKKNGILYISYYKASWKIFAILMNGNLSMKKSLMPKLKILKKMRKATLKIV